MMELRMSIYLPEITISRFKPVRRHADAYQFSLWNIAFRSGNGTFIITAFNNMICRYYQIIFGTVIAKAGNGNSRSCFLAFFLIEAPISKSLKNL